MKLITCDSITISADAILVYLVSEVLQAFHDMYRFAIQSSTNKRIILTVRKVEEKWQQIQGYRSISLPKRCHYGLLRFDRAERKHLDQIRFAPCKISTSMYEWDCDLNAPADGAWKTAA